MRRGSRRSNACTPTRCRGAPVSDASVAGLNRYPEPQPVRADRASRRSSMVSRRECARRTRQRRRHRSAGARVLPRRPGQRADLSADLRYVQGVGAHSGRGVSSKCRCSRSAALRSMLKRVLAAWRRERQDSSSLFTPNNPTGNLHGSRSRSSSCARSSAARRLVVVDEAYIEFARADEHRAGSSTDTRIWSCCAPVEGLRAGRRALRRPARTSRDRQPARARHHAVRAADPDHRGGAQVHERGSIERSAADASTSILSERERLIAELARLPLIRRVWPSDANFLLVDCVDADQRAAAPPRRSA